MTTEEPVARREPYVHEIHGRRRPDDYAWMAADEARLIEYLRAEHAYYVAATSHSGPLRATLFAEMSRRLPSTDASVSWRHGDWFYYTRTPAGKQYREFVRDGAETQVLLDLNALAEGHDYLDIGVREVSPDDTLLAYSVDTDGDEVFELRIRDLTTGADLSEVVPRSYYGCAWSADSKTVLYVVHDAAYRPYRVVRHRIGSPVTDDTVVYEETDERYSLYLYGTRSGELAVINAVSSNTSEVWVLSTSDVEADPRVVAPRREGVRYRIDHVAGPDGGDLYIVTDDGAPESRLMRVGLSEIGAAAAERWVEVIPGQPDERLVSVNAFRGHLVLSLRRGGFPILRVLDLSTGDTRDELAEIPAGSIVLSSEDEDYEQVHDPYDNASFTAMVESYVEPPRWVSIDFATGARELRKVEPTPTYDPADYVTERITATADDGVEVPVTIARRADVARDGTAPCLLYGYGAYGACIDPSFERSVASLLDRGVVYAVAHIRGGGENGHHWWEGGRMRNKRNTFTDFIAAAETLVADKWVDPARIVTEGVSAGGLLQGAVFSMAPERWRAVVARVPFVDVVTTMLDPTVPLTAGEWTEWGDPRTPDDYAYMASYSPYDNVPTGKRPDLLVTGNLNDARVMVREPAKWVAKLRATRTDDSEIIFRAEIGSASHGGSSGRYDRLRERAEIVAWMLEKLDAEEVVSV